MPDSKPAKKTKSNLLVRILAAAILIPVALFAAWMGGLVFGIFVTALGLLMAWEWARMIYSKNVLLGAEIAVCAVVAGMTPYLFSIVAVISIIATLWILTTIEGYRRTKSSWSFVSVPYISLPILALVLIRADESYGLIAIVLIFVSVWSADSLAYFVGRTFGGLKLWPAVSPNKTWSGFFGAVFGGMIAAVLVFYFTGLNNLIAAALIGAAIGGLEQGGDLFESAAKRKFGVKDSGAIIPGHGGVLDRVDGLMAAAVAVWLFGALRAGGWENAAAGLLNWPS